MALADRDATSDRQLDILAARYFQPLVANGNEAAARDMCLFAIWAGQGYKDVIASRENCVQALAANGKSIAAKAALSEMNNSWAMRRAEVYAFLDHATGLQAR